MYRNLIGLTIAVIGFNCLGAGSNEPTPEWPFDRPPLTQLHQTQRKVFIHYFSPFPISIGNKNPEVDYYTKQFLSPSGEGGKHSGSGGYFRQRPLPRMPRHETDWRLADMIDEVNTASRLGVDGFCYDMLALQGSHWNALLRLMKAVNTVNNGFKIMLMPDMTSELKKKPEKLLPAILAIAHDPSLYRLPDGRLVIAPYMTSAQPPEYWRNLLDELKKKGIDAVLINLYQGWWNQIGKYADISWGFSDWGTSALDEQFHIRRKKLETVDRLGLKWMAPVRPQDFRPKSYHGSENANSRLFREMWQTAIDHHADMVQVITWNDYSESSEIAPSTSIRYSFYDLTAYYSTWFKTGKPPVIVRDALYYFYRVQPVAAKADLTKQKKDFTITGKPVDEIELLAFLKAPGTLKISIGGKSFDKQCPAGINSFTVPLVNGRPEFSLLRDGTEVMKVTGAWEISDRITYTNYLYHGDGGTVEALKSRRYDKPTEHKLKLEVGPVIDKLKAPAKTTFKEISGDPAAVKLTGSPLERAEMTSDGKGGFTFVVGPGAGRNGTFDCGDGFPIEDRSEVVFYVRRYETIPGSGWIAIFLSATEAGGKRKFSFTLRNPGETYISAGLPQFKVMKGNFPVSYPAVYRIRRADGKLSLLYNNMVVFEADEKTVGQFDRVSLYLGCQKEDSAALLEISGLERRQIEVK